MARHTTDRFCTSCGSCRIGTVDPYTGELLVEVEVHAIPDDICHPGPPEVSPGWLALAKVAGCGPDGPVYRDECRPGHRCLGGCHEGERCRSEVEREQQLAVDGLGRFLRGLA